MNSNIERWVTLLQGRNRVREMDSWKLLTKWGMSVALTSLYKYMIGYPTSLSKRNKQYLEGLIQGMDWLTNYQMSVVTFKIVICKIIGAIPPLNG